MGGRERRRRRGRQAAGGRRHEGGGTLEPEMSQVPCGAKTTESTKSLWPWKVWRHLLVVRLAWPALARSQSLSVLSSDPDASSLASGENDTE